MGPVTCCRVLLEKLLTFRRFPKVTSTGLVNTTWLGMGGDRLGE